MKIRRRLISAGPNFYMISDTPTSVLELLIVHFILVVLLSRMIITRNEWTCLLTLLWSSTLAKTFIFPARENQFFQENNFNKAPVRRIAIAMNTNSAFTGSYTENPLWYQQFELRQNRILRGGQPTVDFGAANNCHLYVTTMKAMNFQDDIPSILIDNFKNHYVLVFDLTSMQDTTENCHYPELVGDSWRTIEAGAKLYFSSRACYWTHCFGKTNVVGCSWQVCCWKECVKMDIFALQQFINRIPLLKIRYFGLFSSDYVPTLDNDTFAIINTQPSNMQGDDWIMIANVRQELYFAESLGCKGYSFLKQHYKQMMPAPVQSHPSVCGFYTMYAAFHFFKFRQQKITGVHDVNFLSFISNFM